MSVISIAIQKGGAGKTTTVLNLAAALQRQGKRVLVIDADPQASLSQSMGVTEDPAAHLYSELVKEMKGEEGDLDAVIIETKSGLDLVPSSIELANAELELVSVYGREQVFKWMLEKMKKKYDFIFIDCPPAIGMLTINALVSSDYVLMPLQAEFFPMKGVRSFLHHFKLLNKISKKGQILGLLLTHYDERKTMNRQIFHELEAEFGDLVFQTQIRSNVQLAKSQEAGTDIFHFDRHAHGARDYEALAVEFLDRIQKQ